MKWSWLLLAVFLSVAFAENSYAQSRVQATLRSILAGGIITTQDTSSLLIPGNWQNSGGGAASTSSSNFQTFVFAQTDGSCPYIPNVLFVYTDPFNQQWGVYANVPATTSTQVSTIVAYIEKYYNRITVTNTSGATLTSAIIRFGPSGKTAENFTSGTKVCPNGLFPTIKMGAQGAYSLYVSVNGQFFAFPMSGDLYGTVGDYVLPVSSASSSASTRSSTSVAAKSSAKLVSKHREKLNIKKLK